MFKNVGKKLHAFGIGFFVVCLIGGIVASIIVANDGHPYLIPAFVVGALLFGWLSGLLLHGFGSIVSAFEKPFEKKESMRIKSIGDIFYNDVKTEEE